MNGSLQAELIAHFAAFEIDLHRVAVAGFARDRGCVDRRFGDGHRQQAVADGVARKMSANDGAITTL